MKKLCLYLGILLLAFGCAKKNAEAGVERLYTEGQLAMSRAKYDSALVIYDTILKKFPDHPKNDQALFLMGFIEKEYLGNEEKAHLHFNNLITRYPKSDLVKDARFLLSGKMPKI